MDQQTLDENVLLLARFPAALDALVRGLSPHWTNANEGAGSTWTIAEIVAHLLHAEQSDWLPRIRCILDFGPERTFETFNRRAHLDGSAARMLEGNLQAFAACRARNLSELKALSLQPADLSRRGRHPAFGDVTLGQLLATWATHDLTHLHQIARVLTVQNREAVGPWRAYLGVLHCDGHSGPA